MFDCVLMLLLLVFWFGFDVIWCWLFWCRFGIVDEVVFDVLVCIIEVVCGFDFRCVNWIVVIVLWNVECDMICVC